MPLPLLFIGTAVATGVFGSGKTVKAIADNSKANSINKDANESIELAKQEMERQRTSVSKALSSLGEEKIFTLNHSVTAFLDTFEQIKNVDFKESTGLEELKNLKLDKKDFEELREMGNFAANIAGGATAGLAGGALTAFGAFNAASVLATASTGTAIGTLSGAAATNATLAFFGGGSLASGGLGMAGGAMVLGGLVAGPALLVMGLIGGAKANEKLENAMANKAQAEEITEALDTASAQCAAIRRRSNMFYNLLANLDARFLQQVWKMEDIVKNEGTDFRLYSSASKNAIGACAATAKSIKAVLDTPLLTEDGALTPESEEVPNRMRALIYK